MTRLHLFTPQELSKDVLWPAIARSSKVAAPLLPTAILRGLLSGIADYAGAAASSSLGRDAGVNVEERMLLQLMDTATSLEQYQTCAEKLDEIQGHNAWKQDKISQDADYNPGIIEKYMKELDYARMTSDLSAMRHLLRTTLSRDLGGMNLLNLYKYSWSGTKYLIDDYIASVLDTIEKFATAADEFKLDTKEVQFYQQSLEDALKYFGRSALTLSGGAILGMKHIGVVKALWEADVLPEIISGASAGSIVAAVVGVSSDEDMHRVVDVFPTADLACFDPDGTGPLGWAFQRLSQLFHSGAFFSMSNMERVLYPWLGDMTFREAHYKTKRILNICVSGAESGEPRLLNYVTAPDVLILSAVCASCSVPSVFPAAQLYEKDPITKEKRIWMEHAKQMFVDGSLDHDIPTRKLSEMFNVNFFIVSQVNPHVRMFLNAEQEFQTNPPSRSWPSIFDIASMARNAKEAVRQGILHRAQQLKDAGIGEDYLRWASVLSQKYTGDINILPEIRMSEITTMLANPSVEFMLRAVSDGERCTWPRIYRIKNCVAIELALIRAIHTLRTRVNFGPEARAAREAMKSAGRGRSFSICGQRPGFLRRRSLSTEQFTGGDTLMGITQTSSNPPTPGPPTKLRRNQSLGQLDRFSFGGLSGFSLSRTQTPLVSPAASFDQLTATGYFDGVLKMTVSSPSDSNDVLYLQMPET